MKAALFYGGNDIRLKTVPIPKPERGHVQVRVQATGICGGDISGYKTQPVRPHSARMAGHEPTGIISALGEGVSKFEIGDRVAIEPTVPCNECPQCMNGNYNICPKLQHVGGMKRGGGFAEYMTTPVDNAYFLPPNVSFEAGALVEVYAVAVHALARTPVQPGDKVVVIGSGPVGMTIAQMADVAGAQSVIILGKPDQPLKIAQEMMSCQTINVDQEDPAGTVKKITGGTGATVVFEAVGGRANTLEQATEIAAKRGRICMVGGHSAPLSFHEGYARSKELTISWSFCYGRRDGEKEFQLAIDLLATGKLNPDPLITHQYPLDNVLQAFETAAGREVYGSIKVLVLP